jgi:MFS transporter, CP family, cyanate transporter
MRAPNKDFDSASSGRLLTCIALLWLAGTGLRLTILAVPPVIPLIHADLGMSETQVGILSGLPPVLFGLAAVPGSLLIARFGALPTLIAGLLATAVGSALRGAAPDVVLLYAATFLTGVGVAVMQPALPPLVRNWLPDRIGFGTAVYTNGLLVGEILPVSIPLVLPQTLDHWRVSLVAWALPVVAIALAVFVLAPRDRPLKLGPATTARRWWPDWGSGLLWRLGVMLGSVNAMYFSTNAFLPEYLHYLGRDDLRSIALTANNVGQLPASILLLLFARRFERRRWPYIGMGLLLMVSVASMMVGDGPMIVTGAAVLGFATAATLVLMLALPPLLSAPDDVHRTSAGMFTISYSCAVVVPTISGLAWDLTGSPFVAFVPIALSALPLIILAPTIHFKHDVAHP